MAIVESHENEYTPCPTCSRCQKSTSRAADVVVKLRVPRVGSEPLALAKRVILESISEAVELEGGRGSQNPSSATGFDGYLHLRRRFALTSEAVAGPFIHAKVKQPWINRAEPRAGRAPIPSARRGAGVRTSTRCARGRGRLLQNPAFWSSEPSASRSGAPILWAKARGRSR